MNPSRLERLGDRLSHLRIAPATAIVLAMSCGVVPLALLRDGPAAADSEQVGKNLPLILQNSRDYSRKGRYAEGLEQADRALALAPSSFKAYWARATASSGLGHHRDALWRTSARRSR